MRVGFNYPWSHRLCGADIGPNPHVKAPQWLAERKLTEEGKLDKLPTPMLFKHIDRNLGNLRLMGVEVVRYWILCNGFNYYGLVGPNRRNTPSPNPPAPYYDWEFTPTFSTDRRYAFHFEELLRRFKKAGMLMIPSLISFEFGGNSRTRDALGLAPGGKTDCLKDPGKRLIFLGSILNDLLNVSKPFKETILAWELMNEPFWNTTPIGPLTTKNFEKWMPGAPPPEVGAFVRYPEITRDEMAEFLRDGIGLIEGKGFVSTVGHRLFRDIDPRDPDHFPTGGRPQFHYYAKPGVGLGDPFQIKGSGLFSGANKPFLGEFDSDRNGSGNPWRELGDKDSTLKRLELLGDEGCELALLWPDMGDKQDEYIVKADPIKMMPPTRQALVAFTGGKLPRVEE